MAEFQKIEKGGLRELAEYLDVSRREYSVGVYDVSPDKKQVVTSFRDGSHKVDTVNIPKKYAATFKSLEDFKAYLLNPTSRVFYSDDAEVPGVVMVSTDAVTADLQRDTNHQDIARLPLEYAEEFKAFLELTQGVTQMRLWRALIGELHGCFDAALIGYVGSIQKVAQADTKVEIDRTGLANGSAQSSVRLVFANDTESSEFPVDWMYNGRIFECMEDEFSIDCRINLVAGDRLSFEFIPRRLEQAKEAARARLVETIRVDVPDHISVYSGYFNSLDKVGV